MRAQWQLAAGGLGALFAAKDYIWIALLFGAFGASIVDAFILFNKGNIIAGIIFSFLATVMTMWIPLEYLSSISIYSMPVTMSIYNFIAPLPIIGTWLVYIMDFMRFIGFVYLVGYPFVRYVCE